MRSATSSAAEAETPGRISPNSSPPYRQGMSLARPVERIFAKRLITASPTG